MAHTEEEITLPTENRMRAIQHLANVQSIRINSFRAILEKETSTISDTGSQNLDHFFKSTKSFLFIITHVSTKEATNAPTRIEISLVRGGNEYLLKSETPAAAGISVDFAGQTIAGPGDSLRAKFVGGTSANAIEMSIHGYTIEGG